MEEEDNVDLWNKCPNIPCLLLPRWRYDIDMVYNRHPRSACSTQDLQQNNCKSTKYPTFHWKINNNKLKTKKLASKDWLRKTLLWFVWHGLRIKEMIKNCMVLSVMNWIQTWWTFAVLWVTLFIFPT